MAVTNWTTIQSGTDTGDTVSGKLDATFTNIDTKFTAQDVVEADIESRLTVVETASQSAYCGYTSAPALALTNGFQKVTGFTPTITPVNITESTGTVTINRDGVYAFDLERIYINEDTSPSQPIMLYIELRKNGITLISRNLIIGAATSNDEPAIAAFSTPLLLEVVSSDYFEIYVKAEEGVGSPSDTQLARANFTISRTH